MISMNTQTRTRRRFPRSFSLAVGQKKGITTRESEGEGNGNDRWQKLRVIVRECFPFLLRSESRTVERKERNRE